jgi:mono/diheme cytochrome c family protein
MQSVIRSRDVDLALAVTLALAASALGCSRPGGPGAFVGQDPNWGAPRMMMNGGNGDAGVMAIEQPLCSQVTSAQTMPARGVVTTGTGGGGSSSQTIFVSDLFSQFKSICGGCHVDTNLGMFQVKSGTFAQMVDMAVAAIEEPSDPTKSMPPSSPQIFFSQRMPTDPIVQLDKMLHVWIDMGKPASAFTITTGSSVDMTADYTVTPDMGLQLTNIGSCVPNKAMYATSTHTMDDLDTFFTGATQLPATIDKTDLVSLDSSILAQNGVISYAPTYPLFSDDSGKMRYVRVPRGQSIQFDKATQSFKIPANTRFYKTFLKKIIDADGSERWRKIETRLIVARPDSVQPDGTAAQNALYGTYLWNEDESGATLLADPLRNGKPFRDHMFTYVLDEPRAQSIIDALPPGGDLEFALEQDNKGVMRHYAVPGSTRCVQCHMGSPSASFVLGFTPLQVARKPAGVSGVIEDTKGDELTQLQRLIDLGVISGMTSPDDVLPLEKSEGTRTPRNDYELVAQSYVLGNCSHCHNPRGFPSVKEPLLKNVLNFLPSPTGGLFRMPLTLMSPVRFRGEAQNLLLPYITPSLRDLPDDIAHPKYFDCTQGDPSHFCKSKTTTTEWIEAPWRSLIYRNVDTPFDYIDDFAIFPHMPLNSSGYDCRAPVIMAEWMVTIPNRLGNPALNENATVLGGSTLDGYYAKNANTDAQPYVEVLPDDPGYDLAVQATKERLDQYHTGHRYSYCVDTTDIIDPYITDQVDRGVPVVLDTKNVYDPKNPMKLVMPSIVGVPIKPHWVVTDTTDAPGDWLPRRPDWSDAVIMQKVSGASPTLGPSDLETLTDVVSSLKDLKLTQDVRTALTTSVPYGLWTVKPGCDFTGIPTAGSFQGANRPDWMQRLDTPPPDSAPVYMMTAGEAIFKSVCFNCHGLKADSNGLLADEIALMTGGDARVANFRDGILGPLATPGVNRMKVFGDAASSIGLTADDAAARYMAWMALGGTNRNLPRALLQLVSNVPVFGNHRNHIDAGGNPNMLQLGFQLCEGIMTSTQNVSGLTLDTLFGKGYIDWGKQTALVDKAGDAELWLKLCSLNNRPVVHVPSFQVSADTGNATLGGIDGTSLYWGDGGHYPAGAPVLDQHGHLQQGITADNTFPMCVQLPSDPTTAAAIDKFLKANPIGGPSGPVMPYCPPGLFADGNKLTAMYVSDNGMSGTAYPDAKKWAARGAINAGAAVFLYLDQLERGQIKPTPLYTQCDQLNKAPTTP